jgi:hypothetical protein
MNDNDHDQRDRPECGIALPLLLPGYLGDLT